MNLYSKIAKMTYQQLIRHFGTQAEAARKLGVRQSTVSSWRISFPKWRREWVAGKIWQANGG